MKNANSHNKPSPSDTPSAKPVDTGKKSKIRKEDKEYHANEPHKGNIANRHENEEQPVYPVKR